MAYQIEGLPYAAYQGLFEMSDAELAARNARRVRADSPSGYPCRVSLEEAAPGEELVLLNHVSLDAPTPFRASHAIYVRRDAETAYYADEIPPLFASRTLSLRGFDAQGMLKGGLLAMPGDADAGIRELFAQGEIDTIHAHSAAYGCFLARISRS